MNKEKVKLIVKNMELLVQSLKLELEEKSELELDMWSQQFPDQYIMNKYEPDYYEEP